MVGKESIGSKIFDVFNILLMLLLCVVMLYPFLHVIAVSLSSSEPILRGDITIFPKGFNVGGYKYIFQDPFLYSGYAHSIIYALGSTLFMLTFTSLMAYPLTLPDFMAKKFLSIFLVITMFFSGGLIPSYLLARSLHLLDTYWIMIIPGCVSAFNVFLFRSFYQSIPADLRESAVIDGANDIQILTKIYLPLSKPLLATFALFGIVGSWNGWFEALVYLQDENKYPLQLILRKYLFSLSFDSGTGTEVMQAMLAQMNVNAKNIQMAIVVIAMFPIMVIYPFLQKYFVKGVMIGAVKG
ncbi:MULTISPECIES: carbohydrate ABC transporter permease [Paenibacillus]|uniref:Carbohydrate ABC transporter permease n=1 Tax=Paenibacillus agri TaxID=2744309 RepID=A0A850EK48_9BACL|nr:carbohydrate ABC transporter permease [Paenibacillus agri]NUU60099.1 carbohydrate ABC transporter permease [Paenibacillus agri]